MIDHWLDEEIARAHARRVLRSRPLERWFLGAMLLLCTGYLAYAACTQGKVTGPRDPAGAIGEEGDPCDRPRESETRGAPVAQRSEQRSAAVGNDKANGECMTRTYARTRGRLFISVGRLALGRAWEPALSFTRAGDL